VNETKYRKRTEKEARERMESRRAAKEEMRIKLAGKMFWPANRGTMNEGRNQAKRARRAMRFGMPPLVAPPQPKPVASAFNCKPAYKRGMKGLHMPRFAPAAAFEKTEKHPKRTGQKRTTSHR
jgi:hypothetical protein